MIGFYGSYTQGETYNIIFEYVDQGSLEDYFQTTPPPSKKEDIEAFWTGLLGVFRGLRNIHRIGQSNRELMVLNG